MSNNKHAYGWFGHILVCHTDESSHKKENVIAIPTLPFMALVKDMENCKLDPRIGCERLGVIDSEYYFLATGHPNSFSEGYTYYGGVFQEADDRQEMASLAVDPRESQDAEYIKAMKEIYGIKLPTCRAMIGCASDH